MAANDVERLRELYRSLSDVELLRLAGTRDGLTETAQQAADAEIQERGLVVPVSEDTLEAVVSAEEHIEDEPWDEVRAFQVPSEAESAYCKLGEHEVPVRLAYAERQLEENGPVVRTNWLALFVPKSRKDEARRVLERELNLFPAAEKHPAADGGAEGLEDDELFPVGTFDDLADAELAQKALREAGIWFKVEDDGLTVEVKPADVDSALAAVEGGFAQADD